MENPISRYLENTRRPHEWLGRFEKTNQLFFHRFTNHDFSSIYCSLFLMISSFFFSSQFESLQLEKEELTKVAESRLTEISQLTQHITDLKQEMEKVKLASQQVCSSRPVARSPVICHSVCLLVCTFLFSWRFLPFLWVVSLSAGLREFS